MLMKKLYEWREAILLAVFVVFVFTKTPVWLSSSSNIHAILAVLVPIVLLALVYYYANEKQEKNESVFG